jgi:hypothetical protein
MHHFDSKLDGIKHREVSFVSSSSLQSRSESRGMSFYAAAVAKLTEACTNETASWQCLVKYTVSGCVRGQYDRPKI